MFPFVLRSRTLIVGREELGRSKRRLHFVLITHDLSDSSREAILKDFVHYPVVQHYTSADLEKHFGVQGAKVIGFAKSGLAQSIYAELKPHRVNRPPLPPQKSEPAVASPKAVPPAAAPGPPAPTPQPRLRRRTHRRPGPPRGFNVGPRTRLPNGQP
jgi:hypothetical protein